MRCVTCGHKRSNIIKTQHVKRGDGEYIRRRRECDECGERWTTYERCEDDDAEFPLLAAEVSRDLHSIAEKLLTKTG